ncbi:hypothetical protein P0136_09610 [Lentisphaerota bacterium ZTH]|nr:hypothetical protein JYG24_12875 [Lentisphaerota bacterium]WET05621.1 hypothetical protein P0136_09610 [Lentisphaerota bacterium ZTH]
MKIKAKDYSQLVRAVKHGTSFRYSNITRSDKKKQALRSLQKRLKVLDEMPLSDIQIEEYTRQLIIISTKIRGKKRHTTSGKHLLSLLNSSSDLSIYVSGFIKRYVNKSKLDYEDMLTYANIDFEDARSNKKIGYFGFDSKKGTSTKPSMDIDELQTGDILLLADLSEVTHMEISLAQALFNPERLAQSKLTHAGIFDGNGQVILEASGEAGLRRYPLPSKKKGYKYQVWRLDCADAAEKDLSQIAVDIANSLIEKKEIKQIDFKTRGAGKTFGAYSILGSFKGSPWKRKKTARKLDKINSNIFKERVFFCSNFVLECFEIARLRTGYKEHLFDVDYRHASPKNIQASLMRHGHQWHYAGYYVSEGLENYFKLPTFEKFKEEHNLTFSTSEIGEIARNIKLFHYTPISSASYRVLRRNIPQKRQALMKIIDLVNSLLYKFPGSRSGLVKLCQKAIHDLQLLEYYLEDME